MAIKFNISSNALTQYGKLIDSAKLHKDFNVANLSGISDPQSRKSYIYTYAMLKNNPSFSQNDFDDNYYQTIMKTDPVAAANYIGYKAMGTRDEEFEKYWNDSREHYEGEATRAGLDGWTRAGKSVGVMFEQAWYSTLGQLDSWMDAAHTFFFDTININKRIAESTGAMTTNGTVDSNRKALNDRLDDDKWFSWASGGVNIDEANARSKINAYYNAGWYSSVEDALDGGTDFLSGGKLNGADVFEVLLGVGQSLALMGMKFIPVVGPYLYWGNVALTSLDETRKIDNVALGYGMAAAKFGIEYLSEQIFADTFFKNGKIKPNLAYTALASRPLAYVAAKLGTEMTTNAIEEMVAEVSNIVLDWAVFSVTKDDFDGTFNTPTWKEGFDQVVAAGISGAIVGLAGAAGAVTKGIKNSSSYTVDGTKVSRAQDYTLRDFVGQLIEGTDGEAYTRSVVDTLRKQGLTDDQIKARTEYTDAQQSDLRVQAEFIKGMEKVKPVLAKLGFDAVASAGVISTTTSIFNQMKIMYLSYEQNRDLAIKGSTPIDIKAAPSIITEHEAINKRLEGSRGPNYNFSVVESSLINADLSTLAKNTGFDEVVIVKVGSADGSRFNESVFVKDNALYVEETYYKDNFGSRATMIREIAATKLVQNIMNEVNISTNLEFYEQLADVMGESKSAYGHYFFLGLVEKHGVVKAKEMVLKALLASPKLLNTLYVTNSKGMNEIVNTFVKLGDELAQLKKSDSDIEYKRQYVASYMSMVNALGGAVVSEIANYDTVTAKSIRKILKDTKITDKATELLKIMNNQRASVIEKSTSYRVALMRALGFTENFNNKFANIELVRASVLEYINSVGAMGFINKNNLSVLASKGDNIEIGQLADIIMADPQLQTYLGLNVSGFNERFVMGLRSVLMDPKITDKGAAFATLSDYIKRMYALAPADVKTTMAVMIGGIKNSLRSQNVVMSDGVAINQEIENIAISADFVSQLGAALGWVVPVETDGKQATKVLKDLFPSLLQKATTINDIYDVLIGRDNTGASKLFVYVMNEIMTNGTYDAASGDITIGAMSLLNCLGLANDAAGKKLHTNAVLFIEKLLGYKITTDSVSANELVAFNISTLSKAHISTALSQATGYVLAQGIGNSDIITYYVSDVAKHILPVSKTAPAQRTDQEFADELSADNLFVHDLEKKTDLSAFIDVDKVVNSLPLSRQEKTRVKEQLNKITIVKDRAIASNMKKYFGYYDSGVGEIHLVVNKTNLRTTNMRNILIHEITHAIAQTVNPTSITAKPFLFDALRNEKSQVRGIFTVVGHLMDAGKINIDNLVKGSKAELDLVLKELTTKGFKSNEIKALTPLIRLIAEYGKRYNGIVQLADIEGTSQAVYINSVSEILARRGGDDQLVSYLTPELYKGGAALKLTKAIDRAISQLPTSITSTEYSGKAYALQNDYDRSDWAKNDRGSFETPDLLTFARAADAKFSDISNKFREYDFYHGTKADSLTKFEKNNGMRRSLFSAFYFINNPDIASQYGDLGKYKIYAQKPLAVSLLDGDIMNRIDKFVKSMGSDRSDVDLVNILKMLILGMNRKSNIPVVPDTLPSDDSFTDKQLISSAQFLIREFATLKEENPTNMTGFSFMHRVRESVLPYLELFGYDAYVGPYHGYSEGQMDEFIVFDNENIGFMDYREALGINLTDVSKFDSPSNKLSSMEMLLAGRPNLNAYLSRTTASIMLTNKYSPSKFFSSATSAEADSPIRVYSENPLIISKGLTKKDIYKIIQSNQRIVDIYAREWFKNDMSHASIGSERHINQMKLIESDLPLSEFIARFKLEDYKNNPFFVRFDESSDAHRKDVIKEEVAFYQKRFRHNIASAFEYLSVGTTSAEDLREWNKKHDVDNDFTSGFLLNTDVITNEFISSIKKAGYDALVAKNGDTDLTWVFDTKQLHGELLIPSTSEGDNSDVNFALATDEKFKSINNQFRDADFYHGSPNNDFKEFDINRAGQTTGIYTERALFFTNDYATADEFTYNRLNTSASMAKKVGQKGEVRKFKLFAEKPLDLSNLTKKDIANIVKIIRANESLSLPASMTDAEIRKKYVDVYINNGNLQGLKFYLNVDALPQYGYDALVLPMYARVQAKRDPSKSGVLEYAVFSNEQVGFINEDVKTYAIDLSKLDTKIKPFIKWVGGKTQLLNVLNENLPAEYKNYYEPFIGGGALLFNIQPANAVINDFNGDLASAYRMFTADEATYNLFIDEIIKHADNNSKEYYNEIRGLDRDTVAFNKLSEYKKAARFMYLVNASFRATMQYGSKGQIISSFGDASSKSLANKENLNSIRTYMKNANITVNSGDYANTIRNAQKGDFVYLDPPYDYEDTGKLYKKYNVHTFGQTQQRELAEKVYALTERGVKVMISNHNTTLIRELFKDYDIRVVLAKRNISKDRAPVEEVIITNYNLINAKSAVADDGKVYSINITNTKSMDRLSELGKLDGAISKVVDAYKGQDKAQVAAFFEVIRDKMADISKGDYNEESQIATFDAMITTIGNMIGFDFRKSYNSDLFVNKATPKVARTTEVKPTIKPKVKAKVETKVAAPVDLAGTFVSINDKYKVVNTQFNTLKKAFDSMTTGRVNIDIKDLYNATNALKKQIDALEEFDGKTELREIAIAGTQALLKLWGRVTFNNTKEIKDMSKWQVETALETINTMLAGISKLTGAEYQGWTAPVVVEQAAPVVATPVKPVAEKKEDIKPTADNTKLTVASETSILTSEKDAKKDANRKSPVGYEVVRAINSKGGGWYVNSKLVNTEEKRQDVERLLTSLDNVFNMAHNIAPDSNGMRRLKKLATSQVNVITSDPTFWTKLYGATDGKELHATLATIKKDTLAINNNKRALLKYGRLSTNTPAVTFDSLDDIRNLERRTVTELNAPNGILRTLSAANAKLQIFIDAYDKAMALYKTLRGGKAAVVRTERKLKNRQDKVNVVNEQIETATAKKATLTEQVEELKSVKKPLVKSKSKILNDVIIALTAKSEQGTLTSTDGLILDIITDPLKFFDGLYSKNLKDPDDLAKAKLSQAKLSQKLIDILGIDGLLEMHRILNAHVGDVGPLRTALNAAMRTTFSDVFAKSFADVIAENKLSIGTAQKMEKEIVRANAALDKINQSGQFNARAGIFSVEAITTIAKLGDDDIQALNIIKNQLDQLANRLLDTGTFYNDDGFLTVAGKYVRESLLGVSLIYSQNSLDRPAALNKSIDDILPYVLPKAKPIVEPTIKDVKQSQTDFDEKSRDADKHINLDANAEARAKAFIASVVNAGDNSNKAFSDKAKWILDMVVRYTSGERASTIGREDGVGDITYDSNSYALFTEALGTAIDTLEYSDLAEFANMMAVSQLFDIEIPLSVILNLQNLLRYFTEEFAEHKPVTDATDGTTRFQRIGIKSKLNSVIAIYLSKAGAILGKSSRGRNYIDAYARSGNSVMGFKASMVEFLVSKKGMSNKDANDFVNSKVFSMPLSEIVNAMNPNFTPSQQKVRRDQLHDDIRTILAGSPLYTSKVNNVITVDYAAIDEALSPLTTGADVNLNLDALETLYDVAMDMGEYGIVQYIDNMFFEQAAKAVGDIGGVSDLFKDLKNKKLTPVQRKQITRQIGKRLVAFRYMSLLSNPSVYFKNVLMNATNSAINRWLVDPLSKSLYGRLEKGIGSKFTTKQKGFYLMDADGKFVNYLRNKNQWVIVRTTATHHDATRYSQITIDSIKAAHPTVSLGQLDIATFSQIKIATGTTGFGKTSDRAKKFVKDNLIDNSYLEVLLGSAKGLARGIDKRTFDKYGDKVNPYPERGVINKGLHAMHSFMYNALEGQDMKSVRALTIRYVEQMVEANGLYNLDMDETNTNKFNSIMDSYVTTAIGQSLAVVFKSETKALKALHNLYNNNRLIAFLGTAIMPFARVSLNIVQQMHDYSPVGLIGTVIEILKIRKNGFEVDLTNNLDRTKLDTLSKGVAKGIIGTTMYMLGTILGLFGILRIDEDKEYNGIVVHIDSMELRINIQSISTLSAPLLLGAALTGMKDRGMKGMMDDFTNQYLNMTFLGNLLDTAKAYNTSTIPLDIAEDYIASYVPSIIKSLSRWISNTEKQYAQGGYQLSWFKRVIQRSLPFIAEDRVDPYTGEKDYLMTNTGIWGNLLNAFNSISPVQAYVYDRSDEQRLAEKYGLSVANSTASKLTYEGVDVSISPDARITYNRERAKAFKWLVNETKKSSEWAKADGNKRKKILEGLKTASSTFAKTKTWLSNNKSNTYQYSGNSGYGNLMAKYLKDSRIRKVTYLKKKGVNYYGTWL